MSETITGTFLEDVLEGLAGGGRKSLPCKYFYDAEGSRLFERICELDEYYLTRTETAMMRDLAPELAALVGPGALIVEYGSGSSAKTRILLDHLERPAAYVPVDISEETLADAAGALDASYPDLEVLPVFGDYTSDFVLPEPARPVARRVVFFPGSTIGNFTHREAVDFLARQARLVGPGGALLIGFDTKKDRAVLERAYDDPGGVTAEFNLNLLARINRELGGDFDLTAFEHRAAYDEEHGRIEMRLVSRRAQTVTVCGEAIAFGAGEEILTEYSHKYAPDEFADLLARAGFEVRRTFTDPAGLFCIQHAVAR